jgi:large subunit ribosomal protein L9
VKVIFIEDVPDVALAGEAKEVADGYGRNYLLPKKLAILANSAASNIVEAQLKKVAVKRAQVAAEMTEVAKKLDGVEVTLKAKVGEKERLYGSITGADIADGLGSSTGLVIDKRKIELEEPIRQLGSYEVTVRFTHDIAAVIKLTVVAEEKEEKQEEKKEEKKRKPRAEKKVVEAEDKVEEVAEKVEEVAEEKEEKEEKKEGKKRKPRAEKKVDEAEDKVEEVAEKEEEKEAEPGE